MTDFAAAVAEYREALARFDAPRGLYADADPRWPEDADVGVWLDYTAVREPAVIAEEAEMERRFGCTTRGTDEGGGERRGRALARELPVADFRPPHARVRDALLRLGAATVREIANEAKTTSYTGSLLQRMLARGEVRREGDKPQRWTWVGPKALPVADRELVDEARDLIAGGLTLRKVRERFRAERRKLAGREVTPAWLTKAMRTNDARPAAEAAPRAMYATVIPVRNAAPSAPQEVKKMGKPKNTDEQIIAAVGTGPTTTGEAAEKLGGVCPEGLTPRLRALVGQGRLSGGERTSGTGRPRVWRAAGGKPPQGAPAKVNRALTKKAKRATPQPQVVGLADTIAAAVDREAKRRCAAILRAHAESIEAELAGSAA